MGAKEKLKQARKEYFNTIKIQDKILNKLEVEETQEEKQIREEEYDFETVEIIRDNIFQYLEKDNSQICEYLTFKDTLNFLKFLIK